MGIGVEDLRKFEHRAKVITSGFTNSLPNLKIDGVDANLVSIQQGKDLVEKTRNWKVALRIFGTIYKDVSRDDVERVEGAIQAAQMLVNLGRLNQAEGILDGSLRLLSKISDRNDALFLSAGILEKRAWIADYQGKSEVAIDFLDKSKDIYDSFSVLPQKYEDSRSTIEHFLGRANFSLGNIDQAQKHFMSDLIRYEKLRENGEPRPDGEAFNCAWMARCHAHKNELQEAHEYLYRTLDLFLEDGQLKNDESTIAHYYLVAAEIAMVENNPAQAVILASRAVTIRATKRPIYIKGGIDAVLVLSVACWQATGSFIHNYFDKQTLPHK